MIGNWAQAIHSTHKTEDSCWDFMWRLAGDHRGRSQNFPHSIFAFYLPILSNMMCLKPLHFTHRYCLTYLEQAKKKIAKPRQNQRKTKWKHPIATIRKDWILTTKTKQNQKASFASHTNFSNSSWSTETQHLLHSPCTVSNQAIGGEVDQICSPNLLQEIVTIKIMIFKSLIRLLA